MSVFRLLAVAALRHYKDPLSWSGIIVAVGAAAHFSLPPEYMGYVESILGSVVGILLLAADGRSNPNTTVAGQISARPAIPAGTSPVYSPSDLNGHGAVIVPTESLPQGSVVVPTQPAGGGDAATAAGRRPGFGPARE